MIKQRIKIGVIISLLCAGAIGLAGCRADQLPVKGEPAAFSAYLDQKIPGWLKEFEIPGAAVAVVRGGEVVWQGAYGVIDRAQGRPAETGSLWQVGSLSKSVSAWGVMKLVEQGQMDLDAPVERYLKRWHLPPSEYDLSQVTIRRLLTHSSGISITPYTGLPAGTAVPSLPEFFQWAADRHHPVYIQYAPGSAFRYSDSNYHLLQLAVEDVTGEPFAQYMRREVLLPLGMQDSWYEYTPAVQERMGWGYNSLLQPLDEYSYAQEAAAGLFTTAADMAKYTTAIMPGPHGEPVGRGVLKPETVAQMLSAQVKVEGFEGMLFKGDYGFGYIQERLPGGLTVYSHPGGNPGWIAEMVILPSTGDGLVVFTNTAHGYALFAELVDRWMKWLGFPPTHVASLIRMSLVFFDVLVVVLAVGAMALMVSLGSGLRGGRRRLELRKTFQPVWRGALLVILPLAGLAAWWLYFYPRYMISPPSQRDWLGIGFTLLAVGWVGYGLTRRS